MNGHMESWVWRGGGRGGPLDMLKDTCGALGGPCMIDRVPLQVAVISLRCGEVQRGHILCVVHVLCAEHAIVCVIFLKKTF